MSALTFRDIATIALLADPRVAHAIAGELEPGRVHVALMFFHGATAREVREVRAQVRRRVFRSVPAALVIEI